MPVPRLLAVPATALAIALGSGCGGGSETPAQRSDRPAAPPPGWHTVRNRDAGVSVSAPRGWKVRRHGPRLVLRSPDRLTAVTVVADRGPLGKAAQPGSYARAVITALPGFEGDASPSPRRVAGSPYRSARLSGRGTISTSRRPQDMDVAVYTLPRRVTYSLVAFRNADAPAGGIAEVLARMRASLRGQHPS